MEEENIFKASIDILLGVVMIATFISVFFFTYVSRVEGEIVESQVRKIVKDLTSSLAFYSSGSNNNAKEMLLKQALERLTVPDLSSADAEVREKNHEIKKKAALIFGVLIAIGVFIIFILYVIGHKYGKKIELRKLIISNIIILVLVAITEFVFVTTVSKNYQIVDANFVRYRILADLQRYGNT